MNVYCFLYILVEYKAKKIKKVTFLNQVLFFLKFTFLGDMNVGKTCFAKKFCENVFLEEYDSIIGACFKSKNN